MEILWRDCPQAAFASSGESKLVESKSAHVEIQVAEIQLEMADRPHGHAESVSDDTLSGSAAVSVRTDCRLHIDGVGILPCCHQPRRYVFFQHHDWNPSRLRWHSRSELSGNAPARQLP